MADYDVTKLAAVGLNKDQSPFTLPPEGWTDMENMCFRDGKLMRLPGWRAYGGATLSIAPHFVMPVVDNLQETFWLYTSLAKAYVYRPGIGHFNITRQTAAVDVDYTAANTRDWNGFSFSGIPILNNDADVPQFWAAYDTAQKLQDLTNWDATWRAKYMTALGPHMFALNVTKGATEYPHMVKWSHPADPGALPTSWDETDPTKDAGEFELPAESAGPLYMGLPLNNALYLYKEGTIWRVHFIGGRAIFAFNQFVSVGVPNQRCVCITPDGSGHALITHDDLLYHDGQTVRSIVTGRYKSFVSSNPSEDLIDAFCFANPVRKEVWFCFVPNGSDPIYHALIWNMAEDALSYATLDFVNASVPGRASLGAFAPGKNVLVCDPTNLRLGVMDEFVDYGGSAIWQRFGSAYSSHAQRIGLALVGRNRQGEPIVDVKQYKLLTRVWIMAERIGGNAVPLSVRVGYQDILDDVAFDPEDEVVWTAAQTFDPTTQTYLDFEVSGRALAIEFAFNESAAFDTGFLVHGYKIELELLGNF